ncbi:unnamed protein product [Penicillium camemberti]|uniref:Str. FM013 n=1 Tax=Penicillium camemberti (strain FM 013) TaxID=1429867 RepID=A0A0G4PKQ5_PENC3|nr:unnamed protein product [Penicillium camemberti]
MNASNVTFEPFNMYWKEPETRTSIINLVLHRAPAGATSARVVNGWHTSEPTDGCTAPSITSTPLVSGLSESTLSDLARTKDGAWLPPALYRGVW